MRALSRLFNNQVRAVLSSEVEPAPHRHPSIERQLDAGSDLLRSYLPRAEGSADKASQIYQQAARAVATFRR